MSGFDSGLVLAFWSGVGFDLVIFLGTETVVASGLLPAIETTFWLGPWFAIVTETVVGSLTGTGVGAEPMSEGEIV